MADMNSGGALRANPGAVLCGLTMKSLVELRASIQAHLDALPPGEEPEPWARAQGRGRCLEYLLFPCPLRRPARTGTGRVVCAVARTRTERI